MAKFDEEAWWRRMAEEIAADAARDDVNAQSDAELKRELTDMFGTSDYDAIVRSIGKGEGFSDDDIKAMQKAAKLAKKELERGNVDKAEQIVMSNRGLKEVRKRSNDKGCAVLGLLGLGSVTLSVWGLIEVGASIFG